LGADTLHLLTLIIFDYPVPLGCLVFQVFPFLLNWPHAQGLMTANIKCNPMDAKKAAQTSLRLPRKSDWANLKIGEKDLYSPCKPC
jgi:hypothetical protein